MMTTNFESALHLRQLAHLLLKASSTGNKVFVCTIGTVVAYQGEATNSASKGKIYQNLFYPFICVYQNQFTLLSVSKGATNQMTKHLACEWAIDNIRVNCVAPSVIKQPLIENLVVSKTHLQLRLRTKCDEAVLLQNRVMSMINVRMKEASCVPLGCLGEPQEVPFLMAFLCFYVQLDWVEHTRSPTLAAEASCMYRPTQVTRLFTSFVAQY
ncbi:putative tropinone reductase I [Dioscorea sansibarensis]